MDDVMKQPRVRFSGVGQQDKGGSQTTRIRPQQGTIFGRGQTSNEEEYDAAYAATVAAVAYAIAAREEERLASQEKPATERLASQKKPTAVTEPAAAPSLKSPPKRGESMKKPSEGSKILRWFSAKEPVEDEDDDDDEQAANVSVRRPIKPAQKKPEVGTSGQKVVDSASSTKKDPSFGKRSPETKGSKKFEQEQAIQKATPEVRPTTSFPREKKESKKFEQDQENQRAPPTARTSSYSGIGSGADTAGVAASSEAEKMADAWEEEKLAKIKKQYDEMMKTITEWEAEKKAKARRQKELKERDSSERKRAKALEEYDDEMRRIGKVATASRLAAEEKRRNAESKVRAKAERIRSTGKLPRSCPCF